MNESRVLTGIVGEAHEVTPRLRALAERLGKIAARCVEASMVEDRAVLTALSAELVRVLEAIWEERGVAPKEVWTELDHRMQYGALFLRLNQDARRINRRDGVWRLKSTKLP